MPSVYDFKPRFQALLRPLVRACVALGLTPNHMTVAALLGSMAVGAALPAAQRQAAWLLVLPAWLLVRMALNAMDGMAAREHGLATPLGAFLNELGDVLSDVALYLPIGLLGPGLLAPAAVFCFGAVLTEFVGVLGQALGARRHYEGPMGKSDRALLVGVAGLITAFAPQLLRWWPVVLWAAAALTLVTVLNRLQAALRDIRGAARP